MRIFIDTNILLDIIEQRAPHFASSQAALAVCGSRGDSLFLAWHSLSNAFYIYGRKVGQAAASQALEDVLNYTTVVTVGHQEAQQAFAFHFSDLEDAMQAAAAEAARADFLLTRDLTGFAASPVPAITPDQFVARFGP